MAVLRILGRTVVVTLLIVTLVMVAFAQEGPEQTPAVVVNNQAPVNGTLTIGPVTVPQQAFLVIQRDASGAAGSILGRVALQTGTTESVVVPLDVAVAPGEQLYAALYLDAAPIGVFEAPGVDTPFLVNNQPVAQPFTITAENAPPVQATLSPTQTPPALITTQPLIQPTLTVPGPVTTPVTFTTTVTPTVPIVSPTLVSTPQATTAAITQPVTQTVAQPTSPLPTPLPPVPTLAQTLAPPTVTPTSQPATPTQAPTVQLFFPQLIQPLTPTPASMPMTGANGTTKLPITLLIGALTFVLFVGGDRLRQRWNRRG
jgi:hypothetical protein